MAESFFGNEPEYLPQQNKYFNLNENTIIIGKNNNDKKNFFINNIFYPLHRNINLLFIITNDHSPYDKIINYIFDHKYVNNVLNYVKNIDKKLNKMIVIDHLEMHNKLLEETIANSALYNITFIILSNNEIPKKYYTNIIIKNIDPMYVDELYEIYGKQIYTNKKIFADIISELKSGQFCLIKNNNNFITNINNDASKYIIYCEKNIDNTTYYVIINGDYVLRSEYEEMKSLVLNMRKEIEELKDELKKIKI